MLFQDNLILIYIGRPVGRLATRYIMQCVSLENGRSSRLVQTDSHGIGWWKSSWYLLCIAGYVDTGRYNISIYSFPLSTSIHTYIDPAPHRRPTNASDVNTWDLNKISRTDVYLYIGMNVINAIKFLHRTHTFGYPLSNYT